MKTRALLAIILFCLAVSGYGTASAEEGLPVSVKVLIGEKNVEGLEAEAEKLDASGNRFPALLARGEASLLRGDLGQAEIHFKDAMQMNPTGIEGKIGMARTLAARKKTDKAIELLDDSLRTSPHPVRLHYEKGLILETAGDVEGACRAFEQGLERYFSKK